MLSEPETAENYRTGNVSKTTKEEEQAFLDSLTPAEKQYSYFYYELPTWEFPDDVVYFKDTGRCIKTLWLKKHSYRKDGNAAFDYRCSRCGKLRT